ncbi:hypothetical protein L0Y69_01675, partial [bacterium]|nr:hypothetical protein [bacterium]
MKAMGDAKLKILYLANIRLPTERAHGIQIMNTCFALGEFGAEVELVIPTRANNIREDLFSYYGLSRNFRVTTLWCPDTTGFGVIGNIFQSLAFSLASFLFVLRERKNHDVIYSRHESLLLLPTLFLNKSTFWESHMGKCGLIARIILRRAKGVVTITTGGKDHYISRGVPQDKILVAHDGVQVEKFSVRESREECRKKLGLPLHKKIAVYTGSIALYEWKGVDVMAEAAKLAGENILFLFVGGSESDARRMKEKHPSPNLLFISQRPYGEIPYYL